MLSIYNQIQETPSFVKELKDYILEEQIQLTQKEKQDWLKDFYDTRKLNPGPTLKEWKKEMLYDETLNDFQKREDAFAEEIVRRQNRFTSEQIMRLREPGIKGDRLSFLFISKMELLKFSFEDWLNGHDALSVHPLFTTFEYDNYGVKEIKAHYLPEEDFKEIRNTQRKISEEINSFFLKNFIREFGQQYAVSKQKRKLVEIEIAKIETWLTDKNYPGFIVFPGENEGDFALIGGKEFAQPNSDINPLPYYNEKINIRGKEYIQEIKAVHKNQKYLTLAGAVVVLDEYKKYLEELILELNLSIPEQQNQIVKTDKAVSKPKRGSRLPQTLEQCFTNKKGGFKRVLQDAAQIGLIVTDKDAPNGYKWIYEGEDKNGNKRNRGHGIRAFWDEITAHGFIIDKPGNEKHIAKLLQDFFGFETLVHGVIKYVYTANNERECKIIRENLLM